MMRPQHIVLTVNAAWNIVNFRMPLVEGLLADGYRVTILAPRDEAAEALEAAGCGFVHLEMDRMGLNPGRDLALVARFRRHFKDLRPDAVLGFTIKNNLFGAFAARSLGIPFIPNVTGLGTAFLGGRALRTTARVLYRTAFAGLPTVFLQNSEDLALFVRERMIAPGQARLLPGSGIDLRSFAPAPYPEGGGTTRFLMIARLLRDKGVFEYVDAARQLAAQGIRAHCSLLGAIGYQNRTTIDPAQVAEWQEEGVVDYLGTTDDVRPLISQAHCIVLPSYREGAPRTLIEGAAMARPAVATDVAGCNAVVEDGVTGYLCASRDAADLARAMAEFAALDHAAKARMGMAARGKMEREFAAGVVIKSYRRAVTEALNQ